jgi:CHAD domain-containing protein
MAKAKKVTGIDCQAPALIGIRQTLQQRFDEMCQLRHEALKWKDPEGVHSMRVASRRLRSAASDFLPYVKKSSLSSSLKQIKGLADALGEVRDQDVAIMALEKLTSETPSSFAATLNDLIDSRKESRKVARRELKDELVTDRIAKLGVEFEAAITTATGAVSSTGDPTYIGIARIVIRDRLKEVEKLSASLYRPGQIKPLHEMRIAAKGLRYAVELFADCWGSKILDFAKETAHLQTALGKLHDCDVWIESFEKEILQSKKQKIRDETETFVWLYTHFSQLRTKSFQEAFSIWNQWVADDMSSRLQEALKPTTASQST